METKTYNLAIARIAWRIQVRVRNIEKFTGFLEGTYNLPEWDGVRRNQIESALKYERELLSDLLDDESLKLIINEFEQLKLKYVKEVSQ